MKQINLSQIQTLIDQGGDYADYLQRSLSRARKTCKNIGVDVNSVQFQIDETGALHPFGEGQAQSYRLISEAELLKILRLSRNSLQYEIH